MLTWFLLCALLCCVLCAAQVGPDLAFHMHGARGDDIRKRLMAGVALQDIKLDDTKQRDEATKRVVGQELIAAVRSGQLSAVKTILDGESASLVLEYEDSSMGATS